MLNLRQRWLRCLQSAGGLGRLLMCLALISTPIDAAPVMQSAPEHICHLVAHLNESKDTVQKEGLSLPRWYDLHHRLLTLLTDEAGCTLDVIGSPWPRSLTLLQQGKIDLMLTMSYTAERNQYADFIGIHYMEESVLVLHKDQLAKVKQLADIKLLPGPDWRIARRLLRRRLRTNQN